LASVTALRRSLQLIALLAALIGVLAGSAAFSAHAANAPGHDGDIWWDGLGHDSRSAIYRLPGGAVTTATKVTLRFRTFHDDATGVTLRAYYTTAGAEKLVDMKRVASNVPCYQQLSFGCDFWEATIDAGDPGTIYYRLIVKDGQKTVYYEDDSDVRDGGWGKPFDASPDWGWAITVYDPNFKPVPWMQNGVIYQIFPDRFRNANRKNDPAAGNPKKYVWSKAKRYAYPHGDPAGESTPALDRIVRMPWGSLPEGYCRNYVDALQSCPKRFPPDKAQGTEGPHGRDYYGGDLAGITQKLAYLKSLGVTIIYMNPIFWAGSNHRYDTRDYSKIDPTLGTQADFVKLTKAAHKMGMKVLLDGVFNHMSSDSPFFDRYHNWPGVGACEQTYSKYRGFFTFRVPAGGEPAPCAPKDPAKESYYNSWFNFDSLPVLTEVLGVKQYIYDLPGSVSRKWLKLGADGWRLDVMQDKSIDFWHGFRDAVESTKQGAPIIGELWKKFDVLPYVHGDTADSSMNYRFRDAVVSLLAPHPFDSKGFPGSGNPIPPSQFVSRMESIREDYPDATYWTLMNLVDSHDTERIVWTLAPGAESRAERELNAANFAEGKKRVQLAALIQMTMPGAPTIYYGDEVGVSGGGDPDDRRTYPWGDANTKKLGDTRKPDTQMLAYYKGLTKLRKDNQVLRDGQLRYLLADDANGTLAYGRKLGDSAAVVVINSSTAAHTVHVSVGGYLPDGTQVSPSGTVSGGEINVDLQPLSGVVLQTVNASLIPSPAPTNVAASANGLAVDVTWTFPTGINIVGLGFNVYRSPLSGGGYTKVNDTPLTIATFRDASSEIRSGQKYFYVVKTVNQGGIESDPSNEASAVPSYPIEAASLDRPATLDYTITAAGRTNPAFGRITIAGITAQAGEIPGVLAQVGFGPQGTIPPAGCLPPPADTCVAWTWVDMTFSADVGDQDEYSGTLKPETPGTYSYLVRFSTSQGETWVYGDLDAGTNGTNAPGTLTVHPNADQTAPAAPTGLAARSHGATSVALSWSAVSASDLYGYVVYRSTTSGSGYVEVGRTDATTTHFTDTGLTTGTTYYYVVKALDEANNFSAASTEASAVPSALQVDVTLVVTAPATTPANATISIAGNQPEICNWCNEHTVKLTKGDDGKWRITFTFAEGTSVEYKYTLGDWDHVEKGAACDEIANRKFTVAPQGDTATMTVEETVKNWRNVAPCGA
jgi:glycosidase/fibronectin type 3 domain-containing protein